MDIGAKILSDIVVYTKYARFLHKENRRETWEEIVDRVKAHYIKRFPKLKKEIEENFKYVYEKKVLPSMRVAQFAGKAIEKNPARGYNCCFLAVNNPLAFSEFTFLLCSGCGVGFSVQQHHIEQLPEITFPAKRRRHLVNDSIEGWADAVNVLMEAYFGLRKSLPDFDYSDIRPKGASLKTSGGKAPGPQPLKDCIHNIQKVINRKKDGEKLTSLEVHDIMCYIADCVIVAGTRRSATISLFSYGDYEMFTCKFGTWWEDNPQRRRANNSVVLNKNKLSEKSFYEMWEKISNSNSGEPGLFMSNGNPNVATNPCIPLRGKILTNEGYITVEQALNKEELIIMGIDGEWKKASRPFKTGENRVVSRIRLIDGSYIYATPNHKIMSYDFENKKDGEWRTVEELCVGDYIKFDVPIINNIPELETDDYHDGVLAGWIHADGAVYTNKNGTLKNFQLAVGINEFDLIPYFENQFGLEFKPHQQRPNTCKVANSRIAFRPWFERIGMSSDKDDLTWLYGKSKEFKLGFIKAVFTADGSARANNSVELYSNRRKVLEVVQNILKEFGIHNTITTHSNARKYTAKDSKVRNNSTTYKINVYAGQFKKIGFLSSYKQDKLDEQVEKSIYRHENYTFIAEIEREYSIEDVYDITVYDETHAFYYNGAVLHNCAEISLYDRQMCNLTEINTSDLDTQEEYENRARIAAFIGTLQASDTDFHYLSDEWKEQCDKEALLGVGMTGIASGKVLELDMKKAAKVVMKENERVANIIGINQAARLTTVKPAGSTSAVLGCSSGIHAWHSPFYIRRITLEKSTNLFAYLKKTLPNLIEDDTFHPKDTAHLCIPIKAPEGAIFRNESETALLNRVRKVYKEWILSGHRAGDNTHNVSCTVSVKDWKKVGDWMWKNRNKYTALSVFPYSDAEYKHTPFEEISKEQYNEMVKELKNINLSKVKEVEDNTALQGEVACSGGSCEIL